MGNADGWSDFASTRNSSGTVLAEKEKEDVAACCAIGEGNLYIPLREILPNCVLPVMVRATVSLGATLLVIAALSFLQ